MRKQYIAWCTLAMPCLIDDFIKARERYNRDVARAARIESELTFLSSDTVLNYTGIDALQLIVELRDDTFINRLLKDIARHWQHAPITKAQRALLGKNTMQSLKTIYINL
jgi:hypothetical protein